MHGLILVKHSLPQIVPELPRRAWHLSETGIARCAPLAGELRRYDPALIVASPEPKAHETGVALADLLGCPGVQTVSGLREHDDGDAPFQSEIAFRTAVAEFFARASDRVLGQESADEAYARFSAAVDDVVGSSVDRPMVVVTHGRVMSLFVGRRNAVDPFALWASLGLPSFVVLNLPEYRIAEIVERV